MKNHKQETIKRLEAVIKEAQSQIDELKKPKTHYPQLTIGWTIDGEGDVWRSSCFAEIWHSKGNMFETKEKAERSNLYKLINSEYDYWFPGFSEKPDFEPNGLQGYRCSQGEWKKAYSATCDWETTVYRWKRSEN